jgi:hypothetical protein
MDSGTVTANEESLPQSAITNSANVPHLEDVTEVSPRRNSETPEQSTQLPLVRKSNIQISNAIPV